MDLKNLEIQKELAKSYDLEKQLINDIDKEVKAEDEIISSSMALADALMSTPKVKADIDGRKFLVTMKVTPLLVKKIHITTKEIIEVPEDHIVLIIADINKYNLTGGKYVPYTVKNKIDKEYNLRDNLKTTIEGFIRHITGNIKPEMVE